MPHLCVKLQQTGPIALNAEFDCAPGELVALVGPSGSGKSSLLRAVAGLLSSPALQGVVQVGADTWFDSKKGINLTPQARCAGLVFQSYALFPHMSAIENVAVCAYSTRARGQNDDQLMALFARLGLAGLEHRLPAQLSGGQQQRVALARALVRVQPLDGPVDASRHGVLLLDEPFSAVDAPTRHTLYRELAALRRHVSTPMVLVTHDLLEARRLADRVVILDEGTTLQSGTPSYVFRHPRNARVAQLVGIQNLFQGRFFKAGPGQGRLHWVAAKSASAAHAAHSDAIALQTVDKNRIDDACDVSWVLSGETLEVQLWDDQNAEQSVRTGLNVLDCQLGEVLELGDTSLCSLQPKALPGAVLTLNLSTAQLRGMGAETGTRLAVRFAPEAIHIMPVRT